MGSGLCQGGRMGNKKNQQKNRVAYLGLAAIWIVSGCAPQTSSSPSGSLAGDGVSDVNLVRKGDGQLERTIGDQKVQYHILAEGALEQKIASGELERVSATTQSRRPARRLTRRRTQRPPVRRVARASLKGPREETTTTNETLHFGMPVQLFKKPMTFGAIITQVSSRSSKELGNLKMSDFPPLRVVPVVAKNTDKVPVVALMSCGSNCTDISAMKALLQLPITAVDAEKNLVYVDLSGLGKMLNLKQLHKNDSRLKDYSSKSSQVTLFDYSMSTLVFDVEARLESDVMELDGEDQLVIVNRWFLRSEEDLNPQFVKRESTPGVGFFETSRGDKKFIERWDYDLKDKAVGVKYYIKNVPTAFQKAFAASFEEWNTKLLPVVGKKVFSYEFIPAGDPRNDLIIAGDVRYNVLEWDLVNIATYGGLGPSISNQHSGEIYHANVMIQGPAVVDLYTEWFNTNIQADRLRATGSSAAAEALLMETQSQLQARLEESRNTTFELKLGALSMTVRSQEPSLEDPLAAKEGLDRIPAGYDFDRYMTGYFRDMVAHELGHNLGLRHNFKGNLGATPGAPVQDGVSRSIMEYLGRGYRHLDAIGNYDLMAISYGYAGVEPAHRDWFCTDEDQADLDDPKKSAECSKNDATDDPFAFFRGRLARATDLLVSRGDDANPIWTAERLESQLETALVGLGSYAVSAEATSATWTNFFSDASRPRDVAGIKAYVLAQVRGVICDPTLTTEAQTKTHPQAKAKVESNLVALRKMVEKTLRPAFSASELSCEPLLASVKAAE